VETRRSRLSSTEDIVITGELSVCPYIMVISGQCISLTTRFITSIGHGAPAITPVRNELKSNRLNSG
jgi:hypothetical protein